MYYIGFDIGSSSVKAALVHSETGESIAVINEPEKEMNIISVQKNWAEQDPDYWWEQVCVASKRLLKENAIPSELILGIGISYQMHGLVLVDKDGKSLRNSIIWCDSRAVAIGNKAFEDLGEEKCKEHLLNSPANFTASKLKWVRDNEPEIYKRAYKFMLPGDYIAYKFTGTICTTKSGLSEGILWDYKTQEPAKWLLEYYDIDPSLIPDIVDTFSNQGELDPNGARESGLKIGTPVFYRAGDQPNNALSLNVFNSGEVALTGGTSGVIYAVTDKLLGNEPVKYNNFAHVNYQVQQPVIGKLLCINGAGIQYRWLKNNLDLETDSYQTMNTLASKIPVGSDDLQLIPFGNGSERMFENKTIGTQICNINLNKHSRANICRAALEGIAFSFVYGMEILKKDGAKIEVLRAGNDNLFRSEIFSNTIATLINQEIEIFNTTGAIGAARAVGRTHKVGKDIGSTIAKNDKVMTFHPLNNSEDYQEAYQKWKNELNRILIHKK
ncbi:xylulokinase [Aquimarina litoralis]|uniref:xylulokinase n=1 Tax=Aquimarina litoralis TaxID=584605 RepID=UPI001C57A7A9|nr:FGGY family carbohydrate kinase [Aquimarina litoralis]MBW1298906.1 carbohydrate kinase [Aquimarina litoralis]